MDLCNRANIRALMEEAGITFRKEYGQNFLVNPDIPCNIADMCADEKETTILEIGPGIGCLTAELAKRYRRVVAVEIDRGLIPVLEKTVGLYDNVTVINADIMKTELRRLVADYAPDGRISVCANLPYYITTPILMYLLESDVCFGSVTVMVQKEVADRLTAAPGSSDYGAITAAIGYYGTVRRLFRVPASSFVPAPKVDSAVVRIDMYREPAYKPKDRELFFSLIRAAFEMRRKTLANAVNAKIPRYSKECVSAALVSLGFDPSVRGERLSTADFSNLADELIKYNS